MKLINFNSLVFNQVIRKMILCTICVCSLSTCVYAQKGEMSIGGTCTFASEPGGTTMWGASYRYNISNPLRLSTEFGIAQAIFRPGLYEEKEWLNWMGNLNLHYLFSYKNISTYPIGGISLSNSQDEIYTHYIMGTNHSSFTSLSQSIRLGVTSGVGLEFRLKCFYINGEIKYNYSKGVWSGDDYYGQKKEQHSGHTISLSAGVGFVF